MKKKTKKRFQRTIDFLVISIDIAFYSYLIVAIVEKYL